MFCSTTFGMETNQFINLVNPVRISEYNSQPGESLSEQYTQLKNRNLTATWLLTYDSIMNQEVTGSVAKMDPAQELGVYLEVTPLFAVDSQVIYNQTDSWHRSSSVFLSGYTQKDRLKLIDKIFHKFKDHFGYFPVSVGAWWIDSYSLSYIKDRYDIDTVLTVSDQLFTDGYNVWGQYWSAPFYPSKYHAGEPARVLDAKLDVVTIQWAPRDPLNGYGRDEASLYSTQDYSRIGLKDDYFEKLVNLYARNNLNEFGQITLGLEGDFPADVYNGVFAKQMDVVEGLKNNSGLHVVTMSEFSKWYKQNFQNLSEPYLIDTKDLLGKNKRVVWYQTSAYRIGIEYDDDSKKTKIIDFRTYHSDFAEPYNLFPNKEHDLFIFIPSIIDSALNKNETLLLGKGELSLTRRGKDEVIISIDSREELILKADGISIHDKINIDQFKSSQMLSTKIKNDYSEINMNENWIVGKDGLIISDWTPTIPYALRSRLVHIHKGWILVGIIIAVGIQFVLIKYLKIIIKHLKRILIILSAVVTLVVFNQLIARYYISQDEISALTYLAKLPKGEVLVYDKDCLRCIWYSKYKPAALANKRKYVATISNQKIIYNLSIFNASSPQEARKNLVATGAKYIYLTKYSDNIENLSFNPRDLGIKKIFENANAQIWEVNNL